jgi:hypothetical protein
MFNILHGEQAPVKFDPSCDPQRLHENASLLDELIQELCASLFTRLPGLLAPARIRGYKA